MTSIDAGVGYPARSVFKLEEIDQRVKLFKGGQKVLDLGAAPGSWSLVTQSPSSAQRPQRSQQVPRKNN